MAYGMPICSERCAARIPLREWRTCSPVSGRPDGRQPSAVNHFQGLLQLQRSTVPKTHSWTILLHNNWLPWPSSASSPQDKIKLHVRLTEALWRWHYSLTSPSAQFCSSLLHTLIPGAFHSTPPSFYSSSQRLFSWGIQAAVQDYGPKQMLNINVSFICWIIYFKVLPFLPAFLINWYVQ